MPPSKVAKKSTTAKHRSATATKSAKGGGSGAQKILSVLAYLKQTFGIIEAPKKRVATMAQISSATFPSLLSRLKSNGVIEYGSGDTIKITEKGLKNAGPSHDAPTSNADVHENIKNKLKGKARLIFEHLADGQVHDKEDVMEAIDCTNPKTFGPLLSRELASKGYVEYPSKGKMRLTDECFPFGR